MDNLNVGRWEFDISDESLNVVRDTEQSGASAAWRIQSPVEEALVAEVLRLRGDSLRYYQEGQRAGIEEAIAEAGEECIMPSAEQTIDEENPTANAINAIRAQMRNEIIKALKAKRKEVE